MKKIVFITTEQVLAFHESQLVEHGGASGVRDFSVLDSALDKPRNLAAYDGSADIFDMAAAYAFGLARNHPFLDGNKRTALMTAAVFLELNGASFMASEVEVAATFWALADSKISQPKLAKFLRDNSKRKRSQWPTP